MRRSICAFSVAVMFFFACLAEAKEIPMISDPSVPAAAGTVSINKDKKNQNFKWKVQVHHLAKPTSLTPPKQTYVVWVQTKDGQPENQGQLRVNDKLEGGLENNSPRQQFDIFITAEDNPATPSPTGSSLLRATLAP
jgi:hypothetical protein